MEIVGSICGEIIFLIENFFFLSVPRYQISGDKNTQRRNPNIRMQKQKQKFELLEYLFMRCIYWLAQLSELWPWMK